MSNADHLRDASPWQPMQHPVELAVLGKFAEELSECTAAVARCIIQGINECEPETGKQNRLWLEDEIADVLANLDLVSTHFSLDERRMRERVTKKTRHLRSWHSMLPGGTSE